MERGGGRETERMIVRACIVREERDLHCVRVRWTVRLVLDMWFRTLEIAPRSLDGRLADGVVLVLLPSFPFDLAAITLRAHVLDGCIVTGRASSGLEIVVKTIELFALE